MHDDGDFLRAIIEQPDEDAPRLVYADWLDENAGEVPCPSCVAILSPNSGGCWPCRACGANEWSERGRAPDGRRERAEFIRVQIEQERASPGDYALERRFCVLFYNTRYDYPMGWYPDGWNCHRYNTAPDHLIAFTGNALIVRRGFGERVICSAEEWLKHADRLAQLHPLRRVRITDMTGWDARIAQFDGHAAGGIFYSSRWPGVAFTLPA